MYKYKTYYYLKDVKYVGIGRKTILKKQRALKRERERESEYASAKIFLLSQILREERGETESQKVDFKWIVKKHEHN